MSEWIEVNVFYEQDPNILLLNHVKPLINNLEKTGQLLSFHIFGEPGPRILLRILTNSKSVDEIKKEIRSWENSVDISNIELRDYKGEEEAFGVDSWKTAYKFLEASSRVRLDLIDKSIQKGPNFNLSALNHYFLNACGLSIFNEAVFHAEVMIGRLFAQRHYEMSNINKAFQEIDKRLQRLEKLLSEDK